MHPLENYLTELSQIRSLGEGTDETSYYPALSGLLAEIGRSLSPQVIPLSQLRNRGAGLPDYGLFTRDQVPRKGESPDLGLGILPARGVVEVKSAKDSAWFTAKGAQVSKYWEKYRLVLVTNYRDFLILGSDANSKPIELGRISLAHDEAGFWKLAQHPHKAAETHGAHFLEFIRRAILQGAKLHEPEALAALLAAYAREARLRVENAADQPALNDLKVAMEQALGLTFEGEKGRHFFQSSLVQTLFYGLFSAWVAWAEDAEEVSQFHWEMAQHSLHVPMVQALFSQLAQAHRLKPLNLLEVLKWTEDAFNRVDRPAFFTKFNKDAAIQYFYEPFLEAFDPELRKQLGVWYTPREIVRYMVSRVDSVLRSELGLKEGLAHESVHILDPCCGTGAYLVEVAATIKHSLEASGAGALLGPKLKAALLQRVHGFELLPAPFVVAHMQIGMLLHQAGAPLKDGDRLSVFLTNALTGWEPPTGIKKQILMAELAEEKEAADKVKRETPILVILGNPPYSGYAGISNMEEERSLSSAYRETKQVRKPEGRGLNDLFVRFFRMAEQKIADGTRQGIVCFISNYSWLDGLSYTGMREAILERFDKIWVDNLNGDKYRTGKLTPTGEPDPSIFSTSTNREGIQVGTAITLMLRKPNHSPCEGLSYREWWGKDKLIQLGMEAQTVSVTKSAAVIPSLPLGLPFRPLSTSTSYQAWKTLPQLFPSFLSGLQTSRDGFLVGIERDQLINRLSVYFDSTRSDETVGILCPEAMAEGNAYDPRLTRTQLLAKGFQSEQVVQYSYRPFDVRWLYWETKSKLLHRPVPEYSPQLFSGNVFLVAQQKPRANWTPCQISSNLVCLDLIDRGASAFPMEIREDQGNHGYSEPHPNLSHEALQHINDLEAGTSDLFFHALAILHAPEYSIDNEDALRQDWPRVPMPTSKVMLEQSAALGRRLSRLLDVNQDPDGIQSPGVGSPLIPVGRFEVTLLPTREPEDYALNIGWGIRGNGGITMPGKGRRTGDRVWLNDRSFWSGISDEIWNYNLGGYQVLKKWLSYRESELLGRELRIDEIEHFTCMARRIAAILQMGPQLDSNYRTFLS